MIRNGCKVIILPTQQRTLFLTLTAPDVSSSSATLHSRIIYSYFTVPCPGTDRHGHASAFILLYAYAVTSRISLHDSLLALLS